MSRRLPLPDSPCSEDFSASFTYDDLLCNHFMLQPFVATFLLRPQHRCLSADLNVNLTPDSSPASEAQRTPSTAVLL